MFIFQMSELFGAGVEEKGNESLSLSPQAEDSPADPEGESWGREDESQGEDEAP